MARDFKVPDAAYYYVKIRALAAARDWAGMAAFAAEKRPPIGFKPFAEAAAANGATIEAKKYALKVADYDERVDLLLALGGWTEAAEAAGKAKDAVRLQLIVEGAPTAAAKDLAEKSLSTMGGK